MFASWKRKAKEESTRPETVFGPPAQTLSLVFANTARQEPCWALPTFVRRPQEFLEALARKDGRILHQRIELEFSVVPKLESCGNVSDIVSYRRAGMRNGTIWATTLMMVWDPIPILNI